MSFSTTWDISQHGQLSVYFASVYQFERYEVAMQALIESIQLALFLRSAPSQDAQALLKDFTGKDAIGFATVGPGHTQAQGLFKSSGVTLIAQPTRVDLIVQPKPLDAPPTATPTITHPDLALKEGLAALRKILPSFSVGRTACVIQAHYLASDVQDTVRVLSVLLPNLPIPENTQDVTFQTVGSMESIEGAGRSIKRLIRWQTVTLQVFGVQIGAPNTVPTQVIQTYAVQQHVDVFTDQVESMSPKVAKSSIEEVARGAMRAVVGDNK